MGVSDPTNAERRLSPEETTIITTDKRFTQENRSDILTRFRDLGLTSTHIDLLIKLRRLDRLPATQKQTTGREISEGLGIPRNFLDIITTRRLDYAGATDEEIEAACREQLEAKREYLDMPWEDGFVDNKELSSDQKSKYIQRLADFTRVYFAIDRHIASNARIIFIKSATLN